MDAIVLHVEYGKVRHGEDTASQRAHANEIASVRSHLDEHRSHTGLQKQPNETQHHSLNIITIVLLPVALSVLSPPPQQLRVVRLVDILLQFDHAVGVEHHARHLVGVGLGALILLYGLVKIAHALQMSVG